MDEVLPVILILSFLDGASYSHRLHGLVIMDAPHPDLWTAQVLTHTTQALRSTYVALFQLPWFARGSFERP
jgi:hypothetical protein